MTLLSIHEVRQAAQKSVLCWLATVDANGQPNVSPKEVWSVADDDHIVVANIASNGSAQNIAVNDKVCLSFIDVFAQKGFKVLGNATEFMPSAPEYDHWAGSLRAMVGNRFQIRSVFLIRMTQAHGIVAPSYVFYPEETTQESQIKAAMRTYGVRRKSDPA